MLNVHVVGSLSQKYGNVLPFFCFTFCTIVLLVDKVPTFPKRRLLMVYFALFQPRTYNSEDCNQNTVCSVNQIIFGNVFHSGL